MVAQRRKSSAIWPFRCDRCSAIQHNVWVLCEARRLAAPIIFAASCGSYRIIHIMSCAPALGTGCGRRPWRLVIPSSSSANSHKAGRPSLKGFMPARCVCLRRLAVVPPCSFPPRQSSPPPQCGVVMHTQRRVMQSCYRAPKGASGLYAARTGKTRVPCSGKLSRAHGLRLKTSNDREINVVKLRGCRRDVRAGR